MNVTVKVYSRKQFVKILLIRAKIFVAKNSTLALCLGWIDGLFVG